MHFALLSILVTPKPLIVVEENDRYHAPFLVRSPDGKTARYDVQEIVKVLEPEIQSDCPKKRRRVSSSQDGE